MELDHSTFLIVIFNIIIIVLIYFDLFVLNKNPHKITFKQSAIWTLFWVSIALLFSAGIYYYGIDPSDSELNKRKTLEFLTGYLLEYSLSIDNLFVFIIIFNKFKITPKFQPLILKWGILGAVLMRGVMIFFGAKLVSQFSWILYIFGFLLLYTAYKMLLHKDEEEYDPDKNPIIKWVKKILPLTNQEHDGRFTIKINGKLYFTSLLIVVIIVELSDIMFAIDSIPAIFSITTDPFIVYSSNIFAILGLRSLYFMLNNVMELFIHLKKGVAIILSFVGIKLITPFCCELIGIKPYHFPIEISLTFIVAAILTSILFSIPNYKKNKKIEK